MGMQPELILVGLFVVTAVIAVWNFGWIGLIQTAIFLAVLFSFTLLDIDAPGYSGVATAAFTAFVLTIVPIKIWDRWRFRHARRAIYAEKKAAGIPYGWRYHLPWNTPKARRRSLDRNL